MSMLIIKYAVSAAIIVAVSEIARHSDRLGALIASLPLVTIMVLIWLHLDGQPTAKIANHAWYTFWYVLPTLPMFVLFPWLLSKFEFWSALTISAAVTLACFATFALVLRRFGIMLW